MNHLLRQEYLICYDIQETPIRSRLFKELGKYGLRSVQKSVFWGYLTPAELQGIKRCIMGLLQEGDKVFITSTRFNGNRNGQRQSYLFGHRAEEFQDWSEACVI